MYRIFAQHKDDKDFGSIITIYKSEENFLVISDDRDGRSYYFVDLQLTRLYPVKLDVQINIAEATLDYNCDIDLQKRGFSKCPDWLYSFISESADNKVSIMELSSDLTVFRKLLFFAVFAVIAQVFLLFVLLWNYMAIIVCIVFDLLLLIAALIDWLYFSRRIILDGYGCSFVSFGVTKKYTWEEINIKYTDNTSFFFGDSEIPGEGVILSVKPISKPVNVGAMTYCRFTHPRTSVFIRFSSPFDSYKKNFAKFVYRGFVANKNKILSLLRRD